jgi:hypothetical protein
VGAALVINRMGPVDDFWCSEDRLFAFREWLVEQGCQVYQAAIADPDSLADNPELDERLPWGKDSWGVAITVYEQRTGEELPGLQGWPGELIGGAEALHSLWADPEGLHRRYPAFGHASANDDRLRPAPEIQPGGGRPGRDRGAIGEPFRCPSRRSFAWRLPRWSTHAHLPADTFSSTVQLVHQPSALASPSDGDAKELPFSGDTS